MRIFELFEAKTKTKKTGVLPAPRDPVAKALAGKSGAGAHETNKYTRKTKHKNKPEQD